MASSLESSSWSWPFEKVPVAVQRRANRSVSESHLDLLRIPSLAGKDRRAGVAQIVEAQPFRHPRRARRGVEVSKHEVVVTDVTAATLDLEADAGGYVFATRDTGTSSPLWGLRVIERIGTGTEDPYLIDPMMLGQLYLGNLRFDADPFTNFKKNLTTLRIECEALYHVWQAEGARRVAAA